MDSSARREASLDVAIRRVQLTVKGRDGQGLPPVELRSALRFRTEQLLGEVELHPDGLPPSAVLLVQHLRTDAPQTLNPWQTSHARTSTRGWEQDVRERLREAVQEASRPEKGRIPAVASALLFRDRSELVASLAVTVSEAHEAPEWLWKALGQTPPRRPAEVLLGSPQELPAALELLLQWDKAGTVLTQLSDAELRRLVQALCATHRLMDLSQLLRLPSEHRVEALSPWPESVKQTPLAPSAQVLLGVGVLLRSQPQRVRTRTFASQVRRWWSGETPVVPGKPETPPIPSPAAPPAHERLDAAQEKAAPRSEAAAHESGAQPVSRLAGLERPADHPSKRRELQAEADNSAPPPTVVPEPAPGLDPQRAGLSVAGESDTALRPSTDADESAEAFYQRLLRQQQGLRTRADGAAESTDADPETGAATTPTSAAHDNVQVAVSTSPDSPSVATSAPTPAPASRTHAPEKAPARPESLQEQFIRWPGIQQASWLETEGIETQLAGVFFLIHILHQLDVLERFEEELSSLVGSTFLQPAWWLLMTLARELLSPMTPEEERDPLWAALRLLAWPGQLPTSPTPAGQELEGVELHLRPSVDALLEPTRRLLEKRLTPGAHYLHNSAPELKRDLFRVPARVHVSRCHVDVSIAMIASQKQNALMSTRLAGLDVDPGWQPLFGKVILIHFR